MRKPALMMFCDDKSRSGGVFHGEKRVGIQIQGPGKPRGRVINPVEGDDLGDERNSQSKTLTHARDGDSVTPPGLSMQSDGGKIFQHVISHAAFDSRPSPNLQPRRAGFLAGTINDP